MPDLDLASRRPVTTLTLKGARTFTWANLPGYMMPREPRLPTVVNCDTVDGQLRNVTTNPIHMDEFLIWRKPTAMKPITPEQLNYTGLVTGLGIDRNIDSNVISTFRQGVEDQFDPQSVNKRLFGSKGDQLLYDFGYEFARMLKAVNQKLQREHGKTCPHCKSDDVIYADWTWGTAPNPPLDVFHCVACGRDFFTQK